MNQNTKNHPLLSDLPVSGKILATAVLFMLALGMAGALGQIIVHDIIPTFFSGKTNVFGSTMHSENTISPPHGISRKNADKQKEHSSRMQHKPALPRGDLFSEMPVAEAVPPKPFYKQEQFIWLLKWTHIHLFGINMIFIFTGCITFMLNIKDSARAWLIGLPFLAVIVDVAAMWLKTFVSPLFFWLHIPGGGIFGGIFIFTFFRAVLEMWGNRSHNSCRADRRS